MGIIQAEGYSEGGMSRCLSLICMHKNLFCSFWLGIVVQDCLAVMENLLKSNNSNQSFFREARYSQFLSVCSWVVF